MALQTKEKEGRVAALYSGLWKSVNSIKSPEICGQFLSNTQLPAEWFHGKRCLDVGCGSGFAVWAMHSLGAEVWGCDLLSSSLEEVRSRLGDAADQTQLRVASVLDLPFESGSFDFVHCNGVLHHTTDPRRGFEELVRVTRPGGQLFISVYGKGGLYNGLVQMARLASNLIPYRLTEWLLNPIMGKRTIPNSFMPAKVSVLDNMYVPIRHTYREKEIRGWFQAQGIPNENVLRTATTIYDHRKFKNRIIHGEGYLQFRALKPGSTNGE